jgi:hypothetical protein
MMKRINKNNDVGHKTKRNFIINLNPLGLLVDKRGKTLKYLDDKGAEYHRKYSTLTGEYIGKQYLKRDNGTLSLRAFDAPTDLIKNLLNVLETNVTKTNQDGSYPECKVSENSTENFQNLEILNRDQMRSLLSKIDTEDMLFQSTKIALETIKASKFKKLNNNLSKVLS